MALPSDSNGKVFFFPIFLTKHKATSLTNTSHAWRGRPQLSSPLLQLIFGDATTQASRMATVSFCHGLGSVFSAIPWMSRNTSCKMAGSWSQPKGPLQPSVSFPLGELLPASFRRWVLKVGERASVHLAIFYSASVYEKPSSLHVLMCYINALKSRKAGNSSPCM